MSHVVRAFNAECNFLNWKDHLTNECKGDAESEEQQQKSTKAKFRHRPAHQLNIDWGVVLLLERHVAILPRNTPNTRKLRASGFRVVRS